METTIQESSARLETTSQPDDRRPVNDWPMIRIVLSIQQASIVGIVFVWSLAALEDFGVLQLGLETSVVPMFTTIAGFALILGTGLLTPIFMERYREHHFEPIDSAPRSLVQYRENSNDALREAGFGKVGTFRVRGLALPTHSIVFLGCQQMVIAEFVLLGPNQGIELVSITESGRVIVTASAAPKRGEPAERSLPGIVLTSAAEHSFEKLLAIHLRKTDEAAEEAGSLIAELVEDDVVDVLCYYNRAFHDMLVTCGTRSDEVGPMTYGRFRFPQGIVSPSEGRRRVI